MSTPSKVVAITGGIGSGKSVVSKILRIMGYKVYDCDSRAKLLMDSSSAIKSGLVRLFGEEVVADGNINRKVLAKIVFDNAEKLEQLNALVHGAVRDDIRQWLYSTQGIRFIETAILYQSGLDKMVDEVWEVVAPRNVRLQRTMARDNASDADINKRIDSQDSYIPPTEHANQHQIVNDDRRPLLPQLTSLLP